MLRSVHLIHHMLICLLLRGANPCAILNAHELAWGVALSVRAGCESVGVEVAARCCAVMVAISRGLS